MFILSMHSLSITPTAQGKIDNCVKGLVTTCRRQFLGIIYSGNLQLGWYDHRRCHYRPGQRSATDLVDSANSFIPFVDQHRFHIAEVETALLVIECEFQLHTPS